MNVFRKKYRKLSTHESDYLTKLKDRAQELYDIINQPPLENDDIPGILDPHKASALSLSKTKLEESVMWAVKGVTG